MSFAYFSSPPAPRHFSERFPLSPLSLNNAVMRSSPLRKTSPVHDSVQIFSNPIDSTPFAARSNSVTSFSVQNSSSAPFTPFSAQPHSITPCSDPTLAASNPFTFSGDKFSFSNQSKASSSRSQLTARVSSNRADRRSAFIHRLRQTRHDERDHRGMESFEKAEYLKEKRIREESLMREAAKIQVSEDDEFQYEELDWLIAEEARLAEMEMEEQRQQLEQIQAEEQKRVGEQIEEFDEFMDEDYEDVFAEVLSQERTKQYGLLDARGEGEMDMS